MSKMSHPPDKRIILITGCSSGIGRYCALKLHEMGYKVIATTRKSKDAHALEALGLRCLQMDMDNSTSIKLAFKQIMSETQGRLDVVFNNAGFGQPGAVEDLERDVIRQQFETNVFGVIELTNLAIPIMRQQGHGCIIMNSSVLGIVSMAFRGAYNASKYALESFADTLRLELHGLGISVSLIEPGPIESRFRQNAYQKFCENIDSVNSPWAQSYASVRQRLGASKAKRRSPFTLGPEAVLNKVIRILNAKHPKPRYYVTKPTYFLGWLKRISSSRMMDAILRRIMQKELKVNKGKQCG